MFFEVPTFYLLSFNIRVLPGFLGHKNNSVLIRLQLTYIISNNKKDYKLKLMIYATQIVNDNENGPNVINIPRSNVKTLDDVEKEFSMKFDTLVADCEGFLPVFLSENDPSRFKIISFENDHTEEQNEKLIKMLLNKNFILLNINKERGFYYIYTFANQTFLPFNILEYQVSFGTIGLFGKLGYIANYGSDIKISNNSGLKEYTTVSCHADSKIKIYMKKDPFC